MSSWISAGLDDCISTQMFLSYEQSLGFCLFGAHVILLTRWVGGPAFPLPPSLCMELPWGYLWKVLLCTVRKFCSSKNHRAFVSGPPIPFIQIPNSTRSQSLHTMNVPLLNILDGKGLVEPFRFGRQRPGFPCSHRTDKRGWYRQESAVNSWYRYSVHRHEGSFWAAEKSPKQSVAQVWDHHSRMGCWAVESSIPKAQ